MFDHIPTAARLLKRVPWLWRRLDKSGPLPDVVHHGMADHVVVVGYGRVGKHVQRVLAALQQPYLIVESDAVRAAALHKEGAPTLFGDAANSEILTHAGLEHARALVVTPSDETTAQLVVGAAHALAPDLPIIARASTGPGVQQLALLGAHHVIHPELEGGLEIVRHTLLALNYAPGQIQQYADAVRSDAYAAVGDAQHASVVDQLITATRGVEIAWQPVEGSSVVVGKSLFEANLRAQTGASVIALVRAGRVLPNPKSETTFAAGDMVGLIGSAAEIAAAALLLAPADGGAMTTEDWGATGFEGNR